MSEKTPKNPVSILLPIKQLVNQISGTSSQRNSKSESSYFCSSSNIQSAVIYLSQELQNLGFSSKLLESNGEYLNLVHLVNCCWELMQLYNTAVRDGNSLHDQRCRDTADLSHLQDNIRGLRSCIEDKERVIQEVQEKERQANSINKALTAKLKSEKDEVRRLGCVLQQREAHHQHELRKGEMENCRLKDRLHRMVSGEKSGEYRSSSISASTTLVRNDFTRGKWRTESTLAKHEEELYRKVLNQYESWVSQLNEENDQLKECLSYATSKIVNLANKYKSKSPINDFCDVENPLSTSIISSDSLEPNFSIEFSSLRQEVQKSLEDGLTVITNTLEERGIGDGQERSSTPVGNESDKPKDHYTSDKKTVERYKPDGQCVEAEYMLEQDKKQLEEDRFNFEKQKSIYTEAIVRLNRERAAFEAEKVELLKHQFLQDLPESLKDSTDSPTITQRSIGSSSSGGSMGELFFDSPSRKMVNPTITAPKGNITRNSLPVVLGPTRLPRNQRGKSVKVSTRRI